MPAALSRASGTLVFGHVPTPKCCSDRDRVVDSSLPWPEKHGEIACWATSASRVQFWSSDPDSRMSPEPGLGALRLPGEEVSGRGSLGLTLIEVALGGPRFFCGIKYEHLSSATRQLEHSVGEKSHCSCHVSLLRHLQYHCTYLDLSTSAVVTGSLCHCKPSALSGARMVQQRGSIWWWSRIVLR